MGNRGALKKASGQGEGDLTRVRSLKAPVFIFESYESKQGRR